jgi:glycosyltransferase involved in cell wall biosynthesis
MKILIELTYYRPHTSGLTIYAERLAKALVVKGHEVTVLTSQYDNSLEQKEVLDGVQIVRAPVLLRISKGVIMPTFGWIANRLVKEHDVIHLHLPQLDAAGLAIRGRIYRKPTIITYHCDLKMPRGLLSWVANQGVKAMNHVAGYFTHRIVTYTHDYADHSSFIRRFKRKLAVINPPVELPIASQKEIKSFRAKYNPSQKHPVIGMAARFATEKGVEVLLRALDEILKTHPDAVVWFAGPYKNILGEESYFKKLEPFISNHQKNGNWKFVGLLSPREMACFYPNLDVLTIPSLNSTEAFGLVQIEAMMNGVPSVASNLPGVRRPVQRHNMGEVVRVGDYFDLAKAILKIVSDNKKFINGKQNLMVQYSPLSVAQNYIDLFKEIQKEISTSTNRQ